MKHLNFGKWFLMLALVILIQNGTIIVYNTSDGVDVFDEGGISTLSDKPYLDDNYS